MIEEMKHAREAAATVCSEAHVFLLNEKVEYNADSVSLMELSREYNNKLTLYSLASDHLVAVKVASYVLGRLIRQDPPSHLAMAFKAEEKACRGVMEDLKEIRFALMDMRVSLDRVCMGLADMKKTLFRTGEA